MCGLNIILFSVSRYTISPLFPRKSKWLTHFFHHLYMNGLIFWHPYLKILIFLLRYSAQKPKSYIYLWTLLTDSEEGITNQRTVYEYVKIMFNQVYKLVIFFRKPSSSYPPLDCRLPLYIVHSAPSHASRTKILNFGHLSHICLIFVISIK